MKLRSTSPWGNGAARGGAGGGSAGGAASGFGTGWPRRSRSIRIASTSASCSASRIAPRTSGSNRLPAPGMEGAFIPNGGEGNRFSSAMSDPHLLEHPEGVFREDGDGEIARDEVGRDAV